MKEAIELANDWMHSRAPASEEYKVAEALLEALESIRSNPAPPAGCVSLPVEPTKEMLYVFAHSRWPEDGNVGKEAQLRLGLDVIPPRCEYEIAYGQYRRLLDEAAAMTEGHNQGSSQP